MCKAQNKGKDIVAVKILQNLPKNRKFTDRELEIVDQVLDHENIVKITEHFTTSTMGLTFIYIVMQFCEGGDLNDYIIKNEPEMNERFNLMTDMARGVLYLHSQNIVHRDLKPENVLLTNTGQRCICKITDFGISRIKEHKQEMFSTQCGSLAYIAPEIIDGKPYSNSVDVFALGLIYFAVYKLIIITNSFGQKSLVPAKILSAKRHDFLNSVIRNERPPETRFIEDYFEGSEEMGRLVYSMVQVEAGDRMLMDKVLIGIVEEKMRHNIQGQTLDQERLRQNMIKESRILEQQSRIQSQERRIQEQQSRIQSQESRIQEQQGRIQLQESRNQELQVRIQSQEDRIQEQQGRIQSQESRNQELQARNQSQEGRIQLQEGKIQEQEATISQLLEELHRKAAHPGSRGSGVSNVIQYQGLSASNQKPTNQQVVKVRSQPIFR